MQPRIDGTRFGSITIAGRAYEHDVVIRLDGRVKKRKKKLSKTRYGTSHKVSVEEARHVFEKGARRSSAPWADRVGIGACPDAPHPQPRAAGLQVAPPPSGNPGSY